MITTIDFISKVKATFSSFDAFDASTVSVPNTKGLSAEEACLYKIGAVQHLVSEHQYGKALGLLIAYSEHKRSFALSDDDLKNTADFNDWRIQYSRVNSQMLLGTLAAIHVGTFPEAFVRWSELAAADIALFCIMHDIPAVPTA